MGKIKSIKSLVKILDKEKKLGKRVGYVVGCFDVLHEGHVRFLNYVKNDVDILVVGLSSDRAISLTKGSGRPVNKISPRLEVVSCLQSVDYAFDMKDKHRHRTKAGLAYERNLTLKLNPDVIGSAPKADRGWEEKRYQAKMMGIEFLNYPSLRPNSSSRIIAKLGLEI